MLRNLLPNNKATLSNSREQTDSHNDLKIIIKIRMFFNDHILCITYIWKRISRPIWGLSCTRFVLIFHVINISQVVIIQKVCEANFCNLCSIPRMKEVQEVSKVDVNCQSWYCPNKYDIIKWCLIITCYKSTGQNTAYWIRKLIFKGNQPIMINK